MEHGPTSVMINMLHGVSWQFTENDLCEMGRDLGEALYQFSKCIHSKA